MEVLLDRLSSGQIVAVISIVVGAIVAIAMISAISKYQTLYLTEDTALRRERQRSDLALRESLAERRIAAGDAVSLDELMALGVGESDAENLDAQLARRFGALDTSATSIEQTLLQAMATDPARKKLIIDVMDELLGYEARPDAIIAAVRPLCITAKVRARPVEHAT